MLTVAELAERIGAKLIGDGSTGVCAVGPIEAASPDQVTFVSDKKRLALLDKSQAAAVIVRDKIADSDRPQLIVADVDVALIETLKIFAPKLKPAEAGIDTTAVVGEDVQVDKSASIGPGVVLSDGVQVKAGAVIGAGCRIGQNSTVGLNSRLDANVVVYHNCTIGDNVIIQANTTVGSTGFGYSQIDGRHELIPHNGKVVIEDFVEVGANCCIDRAKFGNTIIGAGTKIDNLVQIAHNVVIGKCCLIIGQAGIAGSSRLGDGVILAGQVGVVDNVTIGDGVLIGAQAGVMRDIPAGKKVVGSPAIDYAEEVRLVAMRARLPKMAEQLKQLVKRIENLEAADDNKKGS